MNSLGKKEGEGAIVPSIDCVWRSDGLIDEELKKQLLDRKCSPNAYTSRLY